MFLNESISSQKDVVLTATEVIKVFYSYLKNNGIQLDCKSDSTKLLFVKLDKNDPIVKFINTQVVKAYSSWDLWRLIQPCLATLAFEDIGICLLSNDAPRTSQERFCQKSLQSEHKKLAGSYKLQLSSGDSGFYDSKALNEPPIKIPRISSRNLENIRNVDSIDSNQKLVYSRNSAVDTCEFISCEIPCFNFIGSSSSSFVRKTPSLTGKLDNTGSRDSGFYDSKVLSEQPTKLPRVFSQNLNCVKKSKEINAILPDQNFLLSPPTKSVYFYVRPRSETFSEGFSVSAQDDTYSQCSTVDIGNVSFNEIVRTPIRRDCNNLKMIDDEISRNYCNKDMNDFKVRLNELVKNSLFDNTTNYYDDYPENLKYEGVYKPGWKCDQCISVSNNTDYAAFCSTCRAIRPFLMYPNPVDEDQLNKLNRPNILKISNPKPTTTKRFYWIFSRPLGNINLWNLLNKHKPSLGFNQSVKSVAVPNINRFCNYVDRCIKYPMFVIPEERSDADFEDFEYNLPPVLDYDEVEPDQCVTIAYGINPCICDVCMVRPIDTLLLHKKEDICHVCCEVCANKEYIKETCPFCRKEVTTSITVDFFSTTTGVVL